MVIYMFMYIMVFEISWETLHNWKQNEKSSYFLPSTGLVTNNGEEGGLQNGRWGACEVLPLRKGGAEKVSAILKGEAQRVWGSFYAVA